MKNAYSKYSKPILKLKCYKIKRKYMNNNLFIKEISIDNSILGKFKIALDSEKKKTFDYYWQKR